MTPEHSAVGRSSVAGSRKARPALKTRRMACRRSRPRPALANSPAGGSASARRSRRPSRASPTWHSSQFICGSSLTPSGMPCMGRSGLICRASSALTSKLHHVDTMTTDTLGRALNRAAFFAAVRASLFRGRQSDSQVPGLDALPDATPTDMPLEHLAYCLATAFHETDAKM